MTSKHERVRQLMKDAYQMFEKARLALNAEGTLSPERMQEIDSWQRNAEEIEARAVKLEALMEKDVANLAQENARAAEEQEKLVAKAQDKVQFKDSSEYMVALYKMRTMGKYDARFDALEVKALSGESGTTGGYLLPQEMQKDILTARGEAAFMRSRAKIVPMGSRVVPYPALNYSGGAAGVSAFFGGINVYYIEEGAEITESEFSLKNIELHARYLAGLALIPNTLISDSPISLMSYLRGQNSFGGALAFKEDYDSLRGTGGGKLLGILNAPGKLLVNRTSSTDFKFTDAISMKSRMLMSGSPVWVINQSAMPKVYSFVDAGNNNLFLPAVRGLGDKPTDMLLGYPILWTEKLPALGTQGDVCLIDFSYYLLGDRNQVSMDIDTSVKFTSNRTAFRVLEGIDGQPWLANTITLADGTTTVSPYVVLN